MLTYGKDTQLKLMVSMCGTTIKVYRKEEVCACMLIYDNPFNQPTLGLTAENDFLITPNHVSPSNLI